MNTARLKQAMSQSISAAQYAYRRHAQILVKHPENLEHAARILKSMAHPMRLKLLCALGNEECSVKELLSRVGTTQTNVSQHLNILASTHLVIRRRQGNKHFYRVTHDRTLELVDRIRDTYCPNHSVDSSMVKKDFVTKWHK